MKYFLLIFLNYGIAFGSGISPTCLFSTGKNGSISPSFKYDIKKAYNQSTTVVVAKATDEPNKHPQRIEVIRTIKGKNEKVLQLTGVTCEGTACSGTSIPVKGTFLLLLTGQPFLSKIDGNGNDACPNIFEVNDGKADIGGQKIPLQDLQKYFQTYAVPIPFP